jgi:hypothetical protein
LVEFLQPMLIKFFMRYLLFLLLIILASCETQSFESDKRQLIAKDLIRRQLHKSRFFDITGFKEDTLQTYPDTTIKHPLRYSLDFVYTDSAGVVQKKKGIVIFTPDGKSVLNSHIEEE